MKSHASAVRGEAGFALLEALIAVALVAVCAGAALAAVAAATRAAARALPPAALGDTAENVLADLRAATAYDPDQLAALAGHTTAFDALEPQPQGPPHAVHVTVAIAPARAGGSADAAVTVSGDGASVTLHAALIVEAPAPGSALPAAAPPLPAPETSARIAL